MFPLAEAAVAKIDDLPVLKESISGVLNLYSLIYPLANFKSKIYPQIFLYILTSTNTYCNR